MCVLYLGQDNLQVDTKGNLSSIEWYNIPKRIFVWISDFWDGGERIYRVYYAVLKTFEKLNDCASLNPDHPRWTAFYTYGKSFDLGFDKIAIQVLSNNITFVRSIDKDRWICNRIRTAALKTLSWAANERIKLGMDYDMDHLPDSEAFRIRLEDPAYFTRA